MEKMSFYNLLHLSYEDSRQVVLARKWINNGTFADEQRTIGYTLLDLFSRIISFFFWIFFAAVEYYLGFTAPLGSEIIADLIRVIFCLSILVAFFALLAPKINLAWSYLFGYLRMAWLLFSLLIVLLVPTLIWMTKYWGLAVSVLSVILTLCFLVLNYLDFLAAKANKLGRQLNRKKYWFSQAGLAFLIFVVIPIICKKQNSALTWQQTYLATLLPLIVLAFSYLFRLLFNGLLTAHYLHKYSEQYRLAYKITDVAWWMSNRRAARKAHVYPPNGEKIKKYWDK